MDTYTTLADTGCGEYIEKRSRFLGVAAPIATPQEGLDLVQQIRSRHYDARHHCFAYRLRDGSRRYADDGEPQGTAGLPILDILQRRDLVNCIVVVTRYFGGILLGTGGLVRSYSAAAADALAHAPLLTMRAYTVGHLVCDYNRYGRIAPLITRLEGLVQSSDFGQQITLSFYLPAPQQPVFEKELREMTAGSLQATFAGSLYGGIHNGQWIEAPPL